MSLHNTLSLGTADTVTRSEAKLKAGMFLFHTVVIPHKAFCPEENQTLDRKTKWSQCWLIPYHQKPPGADADETDTVNF